MSLFQLALLMAALPPKSDDFVASSDAPAVVIRTRTPDSIDMSGAIEDRAARRRRVHLHPPDYPDATPASFRAGVLRGGRDYRARDPLSRPCPRCGAAPGEACRDQGGRVLLPYQTHKERR